MADGTASSKPAADGTFSVVALIKEDAALVMTFVRYYLGQGAVSMTIYFDGPSTVPAEALPPNVELIEVGPKDKEAIPTGDPGHRSAFQGILHLKEHARAKADWMLAVDADEFVFADTRLDEYFAGLDPDIESVRFPVAEAVWADDEDIERPFSNSWFRLPLNRWQTALLTPVLYGRSAPFFRRGLIGHCVGKHAIRTSVQVDKIGCHHSERGGTPLGQWAGSAGVPAGFTTHFDAISFDRWTQKVGHRVDGRISMRGIGKSRAKQIHAIRQARSTGTTQRLFRTFYSLSAYQRGVLKLLGVLRQFPIGARVQKMLEGEYATAAALRDKTS